MVMKSSLETDSEPMVEHPHLEAMKKEFSRHKFMYMFGGVVCGVMASGAIAASAGALGDGWDKSNFGGTEDQGQEVAVIEGDYTTRFWKTRKPAKQTTSEDDNSGGYCFSCDNAPSRGWGWAFGWGTCECYEGWHGACCDNPSDITKLTHGPFMGSPGTYELYTFYTKDTAKYMEFADCEGKNANTGADVPPEFSGLWWMDGNPASDYVASFGRSEWTSGACTHETLENPQNGETMPCKGSLKIRVYDDNIWSWHDEALGRLVYSAVLGVQLTYTFECGGDSDGKLTYCQVYPSADLPIDFADKFYSVSKSLVSFDMTRAGDDMWIRNSAFGAGENSIIDLTDYPHHYYLKKITNCDGTKGKHWDAYVSHGKAAADQETTDVFGLGADTRETVSDVHERQLLSKRL